MVYPIGECAMSGVSGGGISAGPAGPSPEEQELQSIYLGGENFLARMKALSDAKKAHEEALQKAGKAKATQAALDKAEQAAKEAEQAKKDAEDIRARARVDADNAIQRAAKDI